jgi:Zn-dependent protease
MNNLTVLQSISAAIIPLIFAITWHELAHGWMAFKFGDNSLEQKLSFNPLPLTDLFGTIIFPLMSIILGALIGQPGMIFGWAKPIEINAFSLTKGRFGMTMVSLAGAIANFAMALIWAIVLKISLYIKLSYIAVPLSAMAQYGILINISIMVLNMLPILPLDGGRLLLIWLPYDYIIPYIKFNKYIMMIILVLMITGIFNYLLDPLFNFIVSGILFLINT